MPTTNVAAAIEEFRSRALVSFDAALTDIDSPPGETEEKKAIALMKAKGEMAAALQQLISADTMESDRRGREGYAALVELMVKTKTTAASVCDQITTIAGKMSIGVADTPEQTARNHQITALAALLEALANIAPVSVWKKAS